MTDPAVSVIINCLNGEKYLREAIDSVVSQTFTDWEIVLWDNGSTDSTSHISQAYGSRVRYFRSDETYPLGKARNLAIREARGRYIGFLDCDDLWLPRKIERQVSAFEMNAKAGLVFCNSIFFGEGGDFGRLYAKKKPRTGMVFGELLANYFLSLETVMIRRTALESLDEWFDDRLTVAEEKDLFLRLAYQFEAEYVDEPLAKWRVHASSWTHTHFEFFAIENEIILEKLREKYHSLETRYPREVAALKRKITWQHAMAEWKADRMGRCRMLLRPHAMKDLRMAAAYVMSYIAPWAFNLLMTLYLRHRNY